MHKIILDLCGGTGSWSKTYKETGYDVRLITLPDDDVRTYIPPKNVYGILVAPPCTDFSVSGAQYWKRKDREGRTGESLEVVKKCLSIIEQCDPAFWCLENPVGRLPSLMPIIGKPWYFQPYWYGDAYTKKTGLWGNFNKPCKTNVVIPVRSCTQGSWLMKLGGKSKRTKELRSITPQGFARAFFKANR
ncbi:MAG: DNA cytosine methyltransferase [Candidatus Omnitrophica bacterium]|nr:DNA cytosine methyltransferase [Candidatus Omnitrophota bacterium]